MFAVEAFQRTIEKFVQIATTIELPFHLTDLTGGSISSAYGDSLIGDVGWILPVPLSEDETRRQGTDRPDSTFHPDPRRHIRSVDGDHWRRKFMQRDLFFDLRRFYFQNNLADCLPSALPFSPSLLAR